MTFNRLFGFKARANMQNNKIIGAFYFVYYNFRTLIVKIRLQTQTDYAKSNQNEFCGKLFLPSRTAKRFASAVDVCLLSRRRRAG